MAYTLEDFIRLNPGYQKWWDPGTKTAYLKNTQTGRQISFGGGQGRQYGIGALQSGPQGSHIIEDPAKLISSLSGGPASYESPYSERIGQTLSGLTSYKPAPMPTYESPYSDKIGQALEAIQGRPAFAYDPSKDVGLESAQKNVMDVVSRAAARKNMLYSEGTKSQMGKSALELVPQFEQTAFNRYAQEGQNLYNMLEALQGQETQAYGKYRDTVGDVRYTDEMGYNRLGDMLNALQGMENVSYGRYRDVVGDTREERDFAYQQARDQIIDEKSKREFDETVRQFGLTFALDKAYKMGMLKKSGGTGGYTIGQRTDDLFKTWEVTKKAPAGLEHLGIQPGTPWGGNNEKEMATEDAKTLIMSIRSGKPTAYGTTKDEVLESLNTLKSSGLYTSEYIDTIINSINKTFPAKQKKPQKGLLETFEPFPVM